MKYSFARLVLLAMLLPHFAASAVANGGPSVPGLMPDRQALQQIVEQCGLAYDRAQIDIARFSESTLPRDVALRDGRHCRLAEVVDGRPYYYVTHNRFAADTISTDEVRARGSRGLSLDGSGVKLGLWDQFVVWPSHVELQGRVVNRDSGIASDHATHVAGTMLARGADANALGMAPAASLHAFTLDDDATEMAREQLDAAPPLISNHSYGLLGGWVFDFRDDGRWVWFGDESISQSEEWLFGFYHETAAVWDDIALQSPYYLIVKSAGNERDERGPLFANQSHWIYSPRTSSFIQSTKQRQPDGGSEGYDSLAGGPTSAKNILVVGAVDAIVGGYNTAAGVETTEFSSWGPTDDGRIKPDVVAQGTDVFSSFAYGNTRYGLFSGTSMATPAVSGSLALAIQHRRELGGSPLRSASLRALAAHTADELGEFDGPDYRAGWGLFNAASLIDLLGDDADSIYTDHIIEFVVAEQQLFAYNIESDGNEPIKATLAWTDIPGEVLPRQLDPITLMLVNDLDLRIEGPNGNLYLPWTLDPANPAAPAVAGDNTRDNLEQISIPYPDPGRYRVTVSHKRSLESGAQAASLVLSGNQDTPPEPSPPEFVYAPSASAIAGFDYIYAVDKIVKLRGSFPITLALSSAPQGMSLQAGQLHWRPTLAQTGWHDVVITAVNALGESRQAFRIFVEDGSFDFAATESLPYGGQDRGGEIQVLDGGLTFSLRGNRVRAVPFDYRVTADTRLAFEFSSTQQGEVHAIGLDTDLGLTSNRTFQLYGTQSYGLQHYRDYPGGGQTVQYDIPLGEHYSGQMEYLFFIMDHDTPNPGGHSAFSRVRVYEAVEPPAVEQPPPVEPPPSEPPSEPPPSGEPPAEPLPAGLVDLDIQSVAYGGQDRVGEVSVEDNGATLRLRGNRARAIPFEYVLTPATRMSFDFSSAQQGEVHAIGLDNDLSLSSNRTFELYGTQTYGLQHYRNYSSSAGQLVHYDIPIGEHYTGQMQYLFFIMDHDIANPNGESVYHNLRIYEAVQAMPPAIVSAPVLTGTVGEQYRYAIQANGSAPIAYTLVSGPSGMQVDNEGVLQWIPASGQSGNYSVVVSASNAAGVDAQGFTIAVSALPEPPETGPAPPDPEPAPEPDPEPVNAIDFSQFESLPYGGQDRGGEIRVLDGGLTFSLRGNRVRAIPFNYRVTADTRLAFEFTSTQQGEVHAIGLDTDLGLTSSRTFQLYGTQRYGLQHYRDYPGGGQTVQYDIPLGEHYSGQMEYLFFIMDHDTLNPDGHSAFSRVRVYEAVSAEAPQILSSPLTMAKVGESYHYSLVATGTGALDYHLEQGPAGMQLGTDGVLLWTPASSQLGSHEIRLRVENSAGSALQRFDITVLPLELPPYLDFDNFTLTGYGGSQDGAGTVNVEADGARLRLVGNRLQQIELQYNITPYTQLVFEFSSGRQGEVHAIGLDDNLFLSAGRTFQLYGTQVYGRQNFNSYTSGEGVREYTIPVGQFYTGPVAHLFFIMDHDVVNPDGQSVFGKIRIFESQ